MGGPSSSGKSSSSQQQADENQKTQMVDDMIKSYNSNGTAEEFQKLKSLTKDYLSTMPASDRAMLQAYVKSGGAILFDKNIEGSYYDPAIKVVVIKPEDLNSHGYGVIAHELGHAMDQFYASNSNSYLSRSIYGSLTGEGNMIRSLMKSGGPEATALKSILDNTNVDIGSFQDIVGAATSNKVRGWWGHENSYFNGQNPQFHTTEVMANVHAMKYSNTPESTQAYGYMQKYFPQTLAKVNSLIDTMKSKAAGK